MLRPLLFLLPETPPVAARLALGTPVRYVGRSRLVVPLGDYREVALEPGMIGAVVEVEAEQVVVQFRNAYRAAFHPTLLDFVERCWAGCTAATGRSWSSRT